jgi:hypothetical protein
MKKMVIFVILFMSWILLAAEADISGTWVGQTEVPDSPEPDRVTLVLKKDNTGYVGTVSDSLGMAEEAECKDIELDGNKLTMNFEIVNPEGIYVRIYASLTVEGDTMKGYWESEEGDSSALELTKK